MSEKLDIIDYNSFAEKYNPANNTTLNIITLYEKTAVFGLRMQQIANGASSTLKKKDLEKLKSLDEIVSEEFKQRKIPMIICRKLPDGIREFWKVEDLIDL